MKGKEVDQKNVRQKNVGNEVKDASGPKDSKGLPAQGVNKDQARKKT